jgi:hypothetical protein
MRSHPFETCIFLIPGEHADFTTWRLVVSEWYKHLQDPVWLRCNAAPDIKYDSSTSGYFKLFITVCRHITSGGIKFVLPPDYIKQATSRLLPQVITGEEMKVFNALIL